MKIIFRNCLLVIGLAMPMAVAQAFSDLPESHRYHFALTYLNFEGIIEGYNDNTVRPDNNINRAELVKIMVAAQINVDQLGSYKNCFPDVTDGWYAPYVCYAKAQNWIGGYPDGTFKPEQNVNKAESLKIVLNALDVGTSSASDSPFQDVVSSDWYFTYLKKAAELKILEELGQSNFRPGDLRTRGAIAELVARIKQLQYLDDPVYTDTLRAEFQTFLLLDKLRRENGVTAKLKLNPSLTKTARAHSQDMAENIGNLSHTSSDGVTQSYDRIKVLIKAEDDANFMGRTGENVGRSTYSSAAGIFKAITNVHNNIFMPEPDGVCNHRTTILSTCLPFTEVGIGVYLKGSYVYFTEDFISRTGG